MPDRFDVIVVGAGLIGAASACLFARQGLRVGLVEAREAGASAGQDERVSAVNLAVGNLFRALDVWPGIDPGAISPYHAMKVWDRNSPAKISFLAADLGEQCLGYIIENRLMIAAMMEKLQQNYNVTIMHGTEVNAIEAHANGRGVGITLSGGLSGEQFETRLLVGADGTRSRVRELCGLQTRFSDFAQDAIVTTVSTSRDHRATAWQCFLETGPVAMLPRADRRCSLVWSCDRDAAEQLAHLSEAEFRARLEPLFFDQLGEITDCQPRQRFPLTQHHASRYIADSVALIGDAAHVTHPLAGLGANIGFVDAAALAEVVEQAHTHGRDIGRHSVLRRYERWRRGDNALVLAMMEGVKEIFGSPLSAAKAARSSGMNLADSVAPVKRLLAKYATGLYRDMPQVCRSAG